MNKKKCYGKKKFLKNCCIRLGAVLTPIIPALWEAELGRSLMTSLSDIVRPNLYKNEFLKN